MRAKRKTVTMIVTVTVPASHSAAAARAALRDGITHSHHIAGQHIRLRAVQSAAAVLRDADMARTAWGKIKHPKPRKRDGTPPLLEAMGGK